MLILSIHLFMTMDLTQGQFYSGAPHTYEGEERQILTSRMKTCSVHFFVQAIIKYKKAERVLCT